MTRSPDWYTENGFESEAEQLERAAQRADRDAEILGCDDDLTDAAFLAPRRRRRSTIPDPTDLSPEQMAAVRRINLLPPDQRPLPCDRYPSLPSHTARCRDCGRADCAGGMECVGSAAWD